MASPREIKKRIKATRNIAQITKAIEAVAAVKMRKSQEVALRARPYALAALEVLRGVSAKKGSTDYVHPLLTARPVKKTCLVVVTSDKGLAGAFNSNVLRRAQEFIAAESRPVELITVGRRGRDFFRKRRTEIREDLTGIGDYISPEETRSIARRLEELYREETCNRVVAVFTNFISVLRQEVTVEQLLPFSQDEVERRIAATIPQRGRYAHMPEALGTSTGVQEYLYEPGPNEVLDAILPLLLEVAVYHMVLEANASEHSARMVAMKNASENAGELIDSLTLKYNKARQEQITKELTEITAGAAALEQ
jgi:F-type H+-transporting ATPase subunit gamma